MRFIMVNMVIILLTLPPGRIEGEGKQWKENKDEVHKKYFPSNAKEDKPSHEENNNRKQKQAGKRSDARRLLLKRYIKILEKLSSITTQNETDTLVIKSAAAGDMKAAEAIASALLFGDHFPQDIRTAKIVLEFLSMEGSFNAQRNLGFMAAFGIGEPYNQTKAAARYTVGALGGDEMSLLMLGYKSWAGIIVPQNCEAALENYRKVADKIFVKLKKGEIMAVEKIRLSEIGTPAHITEFIDWHMYQYVKFQANRGNIDAQMFMGLLHYTGKFGIQQNNFMARYYLMKAAEAGNTNAMAVLGEMYLKGSKATPQNNSMALKYFIMAVNQGDPIGFYGLGLMYLEGKGVSLNYGEAFRYFKKSAAKGMASAKFQLGHMFYTGLGIKQDYKNAHGYFQMASQDGNALAVFYLAQMYETGTGVSQSCRNAVKLYKGVCELGIWSEMFVSAYNAYKEGKTESSLIQYLLLAEIGYEVAQSNAAYILESQKVNIFRKSYIHNLAFRLWEQAAAEGNALARVKMGDYYFYGLGKGRDHFLAATYYIQAVEEHHSAQAMFNLAYMCEHGIGLLKNITLARHLYHEAAQASSEAALPVFLALFKLEALQFFRATFNSTHTWNTLSTDAILQPLLDVLMLMIILLLAIFIENLQ